MSEILGAKIWWRWVSHSAEPWAKLWNVKYARGRPRHALVRFNETPNGSPIWLKALGGRSIVQEHSFWEIRNGNRAKFWDDAWNQFPILGRNPRWIHIKQQEQERGWILVNQSWLPDPQDSFERWDFSIKPDLMSEEYWTAFLEEIRKHCLRSQEGPDILRWGYSPKCSFSVKEAYSIRMTRIEEKEDIWRKIWEVNLWPKVALFVWFVVRKRILSRENLGKWGIVGPSQCCLCLRAEDTMGHILDSCPFTATIWDRGAMMFRRSDRIRGLPSQTIRD